EDASGIDAEMTPRIRNVGPVAHQPADFGDFTRGGCYRNRMARRHGSYVRLERRDFSSGSRARWAEGLVAPHEGKCESFRGRLPPFGWFVCVGVARHESRPA